MAKRSKVAALPTEIREWLDSALIDSNFSGYEQLAAELKKRGYDIGKSSVHRHGDALETRLQTLKIASEQAKAIVESCPDEGDAMGEALTRLVQEKMFNALLEMNVDPSKQSVTSMAKAISEVAKASTQQKKWAFEMRQKAKKVAEEVDALTKKAGLSDETAAQIRAKILGIAE